MTGACHGFSLFDILVGGVCSNCFLYVCFIEPCYFLLCAGHFNYQFNISYFSDYKVQLPHQNWEENGGVSYSPNVAYLALCGGGREQGAEAVE